MSDVFISYSRQNRAFVRKIYDALKHLDRDIWIDWEDIERRAEPKTNALPVMPPKKHSSKRWQK